MYEELKREEYAPPPLLRRMVAARQAQPEVRTRFLRVRQVAPPTAGDTYRATVVDRDLLARKPRLAGYLTPDRTVPVGSRIRGHVRLVSAEQKQAGLECAFGILVELEGSDRPACVIETVVIYR